MSSSRAGRHPARCVAAALLGSALLLAGCAGANREQSILNPQGARAQAVEPHWWTMFGIGVAVFVIVAAVVLVALLRRRKEGRGRRATLWVAIAGGIVPAVIITLVAAQAAFVQLEIDPRDADDDTVVEVIGHQYWWEIRYPELGIVTANELHLPTGERVQVQMTSDDVIHSIWVPELSGKIDMIPGRSNTVWWETDQPGTYSGQCAEFCGLQHALMRFVVVAHEPGEFEGWVAQQQQPATELTQDEATAEIAEGREVFLSSSCAYCHAVDGTAAVGTFGPDLTHLASRDTIAAGILPNNRGNLSAWILDPQSIKPGNQMPGADMSGAELQALLTYLESLE